MPDTNRSRGPILLLLMACAALAACSSARDPVTGKSITSPLSPVNWLTPYRVDVIQGNFVSKEQVDALRPGMIRDQVKATLGTPLLSSLFHADRWDYVFTLQRQGAPSQSYRYTVFFKNDVLERFEGDTMPSETEFLSRLDSKRKLGKVPMLEATEAQLEEAGKRVAPRASAGPASAVSSAPDAAALAAYPPLESPAR